MINLIIGIVIGFAFGTLTGIVVEAITTAAKMSDEQVKKFEVDTDDE